MKNNVMTNAEMVEAGIALAASLLTGAASHLEAASQAPEGPLHVGRITQGRVMIFGASLLISQLPRAILDELSPVPDHLYALVQTQITGPRPVRLLVEMLRARTEAAISTARLDDIFEEHFGEDAA